MNRSILVCAFAALTLATGVDAQTSIQIDGVAGGSPLVASGGETLVGTSQGRITIAAEPGSWTLMVADIAMVDVAPSSPMFGVWSSLISKYPWLARQQSTVAEELLSTQSSSYLGNLVEPADLAAEASKSLLVRGADVLGLVGLCVNPVNPDSEAVRAYGQPLLAAQTSVSWKTAVSLWSASPMGVYWSRTYARPPFGQLETFEQVDWTRLLESAALGQTTLDNWLDFTRSGAIYTAASLGLELHVQAVSLKGNSASPPTSDPGTTPGIEGVTPSALARFKISQPVSIAIPFTPPFLPGLQIPYKPGVVNPDQPKGTLLAVVGRITSATHAIFPGANGGIKVKLLRLPDSGGPFALIDVPVGALPGLVHFADLDGVDESAVIPIDPFLWQAGN